MAEALAGLRVVELCDDIAGAYCARQFAAWGADVLVLEEEGGTPLRLLPPLGAGSDGGVRSFLWEWVAAGKRTAPLAAHQRPADLLAGADVLVSDWPAARLAAAGLDPATLARACPRLVVVSLSPYGTDGPYARWAGTDLTVQALSGFMMMNGLPDAAPLKAPANILAYACGVGAFVGAMAALWERRTSGLGQRVEVACLELVTTLVSLLRVQYGGPSTQRQGGPGAFTAMYPCRDGYVAFTASAPSGWEALLAVIGATEADVPEALRTLEGRLDRVAVAQFIARWTPRCSAETLFNDIGILGERAGLLRTPAELPADPHLVDRAFFQTLALPGAGEVAAPGAPGRMSATPMQPPPAVSVATTDWLAQCASPTSYDASAKRELASPPLQGVRVVDLTQGWIGPYATQMLGDLGADVIKVESHRRPDVWRGAEAYGPRTPVPGAPAHAHHWNTSASFNSVNRNKRDLALDLTRPEGKDLLLRLVERADILIENYTPRVMRNFGLDYERLRGVTPRIIMASSSGYGASGPYTDYKANGATTEVSSGWDALLGYPGGPPLMLGGMQADAITGLQFCAMTLVALWEREASGRGQWIESAMFECAVTYIGEQVLQARVTGRPAERQGNRHDAMAPHGAFRCRGDDEWIAIAVRDNRDWRALLRIAPPEAGLADPRFVSAAGRLANVDELEEQLSHWTATQDKRALAERLQAVGVPAAPVQRDLEVLADPHLAVRRWFLAMTHADMGTHLQHGHPWRFSRTPPVCRTPAPRLGEHSAAVLAEDLGLSPAEIERLYETGVTGTVLQREPETAQASS